MSIYTRTGDDGDTSLADGSRTGKASPRIAALGALDEAGAAVGLARQATTEAVSAEFLRFAQHRLFNCSAALAQASASEVSVSTADVAALERFTDLFEQRTGPMRGFVLASGCEAACRIHVARTVVRRAERCVVRLAEKEPVEPVVRSFINRLSDALFSAARDANVSARCVEEPWDPEAPES